MLQSAEGSANKSMRLQNLKVLFLCVAGVSGSCSGSTTAVSASGVVVKVTLNQSAEGGEI